MPRTNRVIPFSASTCRERIASLETPLCCRLCAMHKKTMFESYINDKNQNHILYAYAGARSYSNRPYSCWRDCYIPNPRNVATSGARRPCPGLCPCVKKQRLPVRSPELSSPPRLNYSNSLSQSGTHCATQYTDATAIITRIQGLSDADSAKSATHPTGVATAPSHVRVRCAGRVQIR